MKEFKELLNLYSSDRMMLYLIAMEKSFTSGINFTINIKNSDSDRSFYRKNSTHRRFRESAGQFAYILEEIFEGRSMGDPFFNRILDTQDFGESVQKMLLRDLPLFFKIKSYSYTFISDVEITINGHTFKCYALNPGAIVHSIPDDSPINGLDFFNPNTLNIKIKYNARENLDQILEKYEKEYIDYLKKIKTRFEDFLIKKERSVEYSEIINSNDYYQTCVEIPEIYNIVYGDIELVKTFINPEERLIKNEKIKKLIEKYKSEEPFVCNLTFSKSKKNKIIFE